MPGQVRKLLDYLEEHLFDPGLNVTTWRQAVGIRDNSASTEMRAWLGRSPLRYLTERRLETAARMLSATDLEERRIARAVGFTSYQTFGKRYKAWAGEAPSRDRDAAVTEIDPQTWRRAFRGELRRHEAEQLIDTLKRLYPGVDPARRSREPAPGARTVIDGADWERFQAETLWQRISGLPAAEQKRLVRGHLFRSTALFDLLRKASREEGRRDPEAGVRLARLALASLEGHEEVFGERIHDLRALGWAWLGNAHRLDFDFEAGEASFARAGREWSVPRVEKDQAIHAELCLLEGTLKVARRRYDAAAELLTRAIELAELLGETPTEIAALVQRAAVADYMGRLPTAHEDLQRAAALSEEGGGWHLAYSCCANLAICQMRLGKTRLAAESFAKAKQHHAPIGHPAGWFELRHMEGNLAVCREDLATAERCYSESMAGFYGLDQLGRAALVALDQAILFAGQGRWEEVRELVPSIRIALKTMTLHPETLATIAVVASDAAAMEVTPMALDTLRQRLTADPLLALNLRSSQRP